MKFIYVMSRTDKVKMEDLGYQLIKEDEANMVWVFANIEELTFAKEDAIGQAGISYVLSDMLTF